MVQFRRTGSGEPDGATNVPIRHDTGVTACSPGVGVRMLGGRLRTWRGRTGVAGLLGGVAGEVIVPLLPNLISSAIGTSIRWTLVAVVAASIALIARSRRAESMHESRGLGIVLDLDPGDRAWRAQPAQVAQSDARTRYGAANTITLRLPTDPAGRDAALDSALDRISQQPRNRGAISSDPVPLYPIATLHDSFAIGRRIRSGSFPMTLMQKPEAHGGAGQFYPAIGLGAHLRSPLTPADQQRAEAFLRADPVELDSAATTDRLALVVVLSARSALIRPSVLKAAATGESDEYAVGAGDRCRAALVVETIDGSVPADRRSFELTVRYIHDQWANWLEGQGGSNDPILFLAGPNTIAMALGYVFGRQRMRFIPHTRTS